MRDGTFSEGEKKASIWTRIDAASKKTFGFTVRMEQLGPQGELQELQTVIEPGGMAKAVDFMMLSTCD